jgi:hypothetical protein
MMAERSDAFLALPGGIGTFEELFEVWTWRQLGYHDKPIGLLNVDGYYDGLLAFLQSSVAHGFMGPWQMDSWTPIPSPLPAGAFGACHPGHRHRACAARGDLKPVRSPIRPGRRCGCAPRAPRG